MYIAHYVQKEGNPTTRQTQIPAHNNNKQTNQTCTCVCGYMVSYILYQKTFLRQWEARYRHCLRDSTCSMTVECYACSNSSLRLRQWGVLSRSCLTERSGDHSATNQAIPHPQYRSQPWLRQAIYIYRLIRGTSCL